MKMTKLFEMTNFTIPTEKKNWVQNGGSVKKKIKNTLLLKMSSESNIITSFVPLFFVLFYDGLAVLNYISVDIQTYLYISSSIYL